MSKCECSKCIHNDVCKWLVVHSTDGCEHYKDKSLCVELPCKVGDEVWAVMEIGGLRWSDWFYIGQGKIIGFEIDSVNRKKAIFDGTVLGEHIGTHPVSFNGICKTKEEAEELKQKWLKEMGE